MQGTGYQTACLFVDYTQRRHSLAYLGQGAAQMGMQGSQPVYSTSRAYVVTGLAGARHTLCCHQVIACHTLQLCCAGVCYIMGYVISMIIPSVILVGSGLAGCACLKSRGEAILWEVVARV